MKLQAATVMISPNHTPVFVAAWALAIKNSLALPVEQVQLATTPCPMWLPDNDTFGIYAQEYEAIWRNVGIDAVSLGRVQTKHGDRWLERVESTLEQTNATHIHVDLGLSEGINIDYKRVGAAARIASKLTHSETKGAHRRFSATLGCPTELGVVGAATSRGVFGFTVSLTPPEWLRYTIDSSEATSSQVKSCFSQLLSADLAAVSAECQTIAETTSVPFVGFDLICDPNYRHIQLPQSTWHLKGLRFEVVPACEAVNAAQTAQNIEADLVAIAERYSAENAPVYIQFE